MSESKETPKDIIAKLKRTEATTGRSGAIPRMPKQMMLDIGDLAEKNPDKHFRWVNKADKNKVLSRKMEGYTELPVSEGGKSLGDEMVLMVQPRELYEQRLARHKEENERRLNSHVAEWQGQAEAAARTLRDQYGIKVKPEQLTRL